MQRIIKFRAWHKEFKKMFKIGQITLEKGTWDYEPKDKEFIGMSIPYQPSFVLMQYTGLRDKNGKEIYEGDILNFDDEYWVVSYEYGKFIGTFDNVSEDLYEISDYEIVGNIYDNKDLLEKASD